MIDVNGVLIFSLYCQSQLAQRVLQFRCITVGNGTEEFVDDAPERVQITGFPGADHLVAMRGQFH